MIEWVGVVVALSAVWHQTNVVTKPFANLCILLSGLCLYYAVQNGNVWTFEHRQLTPDMSCQLTTSAGITTSVCENVLHWDNFQLTVDSNRTLTAAVITYWDNSQELQVINNIPSTILQAICLFVFGFLVHVLPVARQYVDDRNTHED